VGDVPSAERDRLQRVHELLLEAGPPPELAPDLESPTLAMTFGRRRPRRLRRPVMLLAAALMVLALAFVGGYIAGNSHHPVAAGQLLTLKGTALAPNALASLRVEPADTAGNWPMELSARGLPPLPQNSYYEVYLVRGGKLYAPCGAFVVHSGASGVAVSLNAPYRLRPGDTWVVTQHTHGAADRVVLKPIT
jgi:hypothetical protein